MLWTLTTVMMIIAVDMSAGKVANQIAKVVAIVVK